MDERTGNVIDFTRRPINEWPKSVYLADLGDGDGCRPYSHIQHPDDTTPEYVRYDLYFAAVASRDSAARKVVETLPLLQSVLDDDALPRNQHDALSKVADIISEIAEPTNTPTPPQEIDHDAAPN